MGKFSLEAKAVIQDDSELLYTTLIGVVMAAIFATGFHSNLDRTVTFLAPEGTSYPFPAQTRLPVVKFITAIGGFLFGVFFWMAVGKFRWSLIKLLLRYREWITHPKSPKSKAWYFALSALLPRKRFLYTFQHVLPKYPLPTLQSTCTKTLEMVQPLVCEDDFEEIKSEIENFKNQDGLQLQKLLQKRYETEDNWVADLWDKYAYLATRTPIYYTNFCNQGGLRKIDISPCDDQPPCARAACMTYHYMRFYELIASRTLPPLLIQDLVPICCYRYRYPFACTRVPGLAVDELKTYEDSKHIIVFRKGILYRVNLYAKDEEGLESLLAPEEIQTIFESIVKETEGIAETKWNPSIFTTQNRTVWAKEREKMILDSTNKASLCEVESAIFHVTLDDTSPKDLTEECHGNICGSGFNRWFDKSLTLIVYANGAAGGNVEHTTADATLTSRLLEYTWAKCRYLEGKATADDSTVHPLLPKPSRLSWNLDQFGSDIPRYLEHHSQFRSNLDVHALKLYRGKGFIKKLRVSPDGFMQMSLQLAFYRIHQTVPKTYETAMTRFFKYGRTETIRTVSEHSVAFTKAMDDPSSSKEERVKHLKNSIAYHHNFKLQAMNGKGADRHMFGLYVAAKLLGIKPKLFDIKVLMEPDQLSTSQSPYFFDKDIAKDMNIYPAGGAFPPQREDGYGVYYLFLGDKFTTVHISSYRSCPETSSKLFAHKLEQAIDDIEELLK